MKRKYLNKVTTLAIALSVVLSFNSCKEEGGLAPEYMPDMYRSPSVEVYVDYGELRGKYSNPDIANTMSVRQPVSGTIPRGYMPYTYENNPEGYELAGQNLKNPLVFSDKTLAEGKELYGMFCVQCHGNKGEGDGILVEREKFPPIPTKFNSSLELAEGKMFHSITYGKGLMGSHSSQLTKEERWKLVHFIRSEFMGKKGATDEVAEDSITDNEIVENTEIEQ